MDDLRILVVADDPLARAGLAALLQDHEGCTVADQVAGDADLPAAVAQAGADVVVWDLGWAAPEWSDLADDLREHPLPLVVLAPDEESAGAAITAGARGALLRDADSTTLSAALRAAARGMTVLDQSLAPALLPGRDRALAAPVEDLTPRERDVLQLLADGLSNRMIAERLGISEHTVKFHLNALMGKLDAHTRTEAVTRAARLGLIIL